MSDKCDGRKKTHLLVLHIRAAFFRQAQRPSLKICTPQSIFLQI